MYGEMEVLYRLGPLSVTPYSLMMGLAALLAVVVTVLNTRKTLFADRTVALVCTSILAAVLGGHLVYSLSFLPALEIDFGGYLFILRVHEGGSTLFGAVFFVMLVCAFYAKRWKMPVFQLMDALAPGAALALCIGRAAEYFNGQGLGRAVENEALQRFPFAVCTYMDEDWAEWYVAVFVFEAAAALVLFLLLIMLQRHSHRLGFIAGVFLNLLSSSQIFFEQLRADDCIRFGFVRLTQLCSLAVLLAMLAIRLKRSIRARGWMQADRWCIFRFVSAALCIVFVEFAFEKPQFYPFLSACILLLVGSIAIPAGLRAHREKHSASVAWAVLSVAAGGLMLYILTLGLDSEWNYLYAWMVLCASIMAYEAWPREQTESQKEARACIA